jgi:hypothetical protein
MKKVKNIIILVCLGVFFFYATMTLIRELRKSYATMRNLYGLSADAKREALIGDVFVFADLCNKIVPQDANVVYLTNLSSNGLSEDLFTSYYMYPRKLFWLNNSAPYPDTPPRLSDINYEELTEKGIQWVVLRFSEPSSCYRLVRVGSGNAVDTYTIDVKGKTYDSGY